MVASEDFGSHLCDELSPLGAISLRRMFGKTGLFCSGVMFAMVANDDLYLRVDDHNREAFAEAPSRPPLSYVRLRPTIDLSFWRAPTRLLDDHDALVAWCSLALAAAHRVASKRHRNAKSTNRDNRSPPPQSPSWLERPPGVCDGSTRPQRVMPSPAQSPRPSPP